MSPPLCSRPSDGIFSCGEVSVYRLQSPATTPAWRFQPIASRRQLQRRRGDFSASFIQTPAPAPAGGCFVLSPSDYSYRAGRFRPPVTNKLIRGNGDKQAAPAKRIWQSYREALGPVTTTVTPAELRRLYLTSESVNQMEIEIEYNLRIRARLNARNPERFVAYPFFRHGLIFGRIQKNKNSYLYPCGCFSEGAKVQRRV